GDIFAGLNEITDGDDELGLEDVELLDGAFKDAGAGAAGAVGDDGEAERGRVVVEFQMVPGVLVFGLDDKAVFRRRRSGPFAARPGDERNNRHRNAGAHDAFHGNNLFGASSRFWNPQAHGWQSMARRDLPTECQRVPAMGLAFLFSVRRRPERTIFPRSS